jgi:dienelactone hydrolase
MLQALFHAWERRLASVTTDRVVRPFDWGLAWIPQNGRRRLDPGDTLRDWVSHVMSDTDAFFTPGPTSDYHFEPAVDGSGLLTFPSALVTPHPDNNTVRCRFFPARTSWNGLKAVPYRSNRVVPTNRVGDGLPVPSARQPVLKPRAAVLVMPQWNADPDGHVGLCRLLAWNGMSALRLSLPYHDQRMPPELHRADYIVSANVARTVQVCRQAVLDARRAIAWLASQGYDRIGILGTSLGSCLALLTTAHEPLIRAEALNHISPLFADVVWRGLSTRHVREGLEGHIELEVLRALWKPISPQWYLERLRDRQTLLVYAQYDLTFPRDLSEDLVRAFREGGIPHEVAVLRCGHYSTGKTPFKFVDGWVLTRFLKRALLT